MRIGIFGGSFNPPHKMHEEIAHYFIDKNILDKIIFVPTGNKYKYKSNLVSDVDRFNMIKIIADRYDYFDVSDFEQEDYQVYTYQTLDYFNGLYINDEIYFVCGLDNLSYLDTWQRSDYILTNYKILVINRNTDNLDEVLNKLDKYRENIKVVDLESWDISSTIIREDLKKNNKSKYLDVEVYNYIKNHSLYNN